MMNSYILGIGYFLVVFVIERFLLKNKTHRRVFIICSLILSLLVMYICIKYLNTDSNGYLEFLFVMIPLFFVSEILGDK